MLFNTVYNNLSGLIDIISQLSPDEYTQPIPELNNSAIGGHTRHIIELFQCLLNQYETGVINYDLRNRNKVIEENPKNAIQNIISIQNALIKKDKDLKIILLVEGGEIIIPTNYYRELYYNYEHSIHHQALIKVALMHFPYIDFSKHFGIALSTLKYRKNLS